jgi:glutaredoxin 3
MPPITIYTKMYCPYCEAAKDLLQQKNAAYEEIPVDGDAAGQRAMAQRANGRSTVPQIFIGATHIGGCDDLYALERAGKLDPLLTA